MHTTRECTQDCECLHECKLRKPAAVTDYLIWQVQGLIYQATSRRVTSAKVYEGLRRILDRE